MTSLAAKHDDTGVVAGIDLGSTTIKVVIYGGSGYIARIVRASYEPGFDSIRSTCTTATSGAAGTGIPMGNVEAI
jgi:activator of 2-hydroxyglutaryl-CoA dehydratase